LSFFWGGLVRFEVLADGESGLGWIMAMFLDGNIIFE